MIEIPSCADRVELVGQAERVSNARFELDHTFDFAFTRTELSFQADGKVRELVVANNQPDPLRLFVGVAAGVVGVLLLGSATYDVASGGADALGDRTVLASVGGASLLGFGTLASLTGWHPARRYITFPDACARPDASAPAPPAPIGGVYER